MSGAVQHHASGKERCKHTWISGESNRHTDADSEICVHGVLQKGDGTFMIWWMLAALIFSVLVFAVYPLLAIIYFKLRFGKNVTVKWILKEIGW